MYRDFAQLLHIGPFTVSVLLFITFIKLLFKLRFFLSHEYSYALGCQNIYDLKKLPTTFNYIIPPDLESHHITSHHITSHHITSHHITSHHITSHHITSHHITSHHITSHHITSHHITSHHITSHHISTCTISAGDASKHTKFQLNAPK